MILNTRVTIACKNDSGFYDIRNVNIFKLSNDPSTLFKLSIYKRKEFLIKVKCPLCGDIHNYKFNIRSLLTQTIAICGCDLVGEPVIVIGRENRVTELVGKYREINLRIPALI